MDHAARTTKAAGNPAEKLKDIAEKLKDTVEKLKDIAEKLHTDANTALKDAVELDVDNHKARFAYIIIFSICIMSGLVPMSEKEMNKRAKQEREMLRLQQKALRQAVEKAKKKQDDWVMVKHGDISAIDMIKHAMKGGGKRKTRKHKKKHRRKTKRKRKRRVKRRKKTTRKKRGRGMGPSKMAKVGVAALAASEMMKQGTAAVSPQARTVQQQLRSADCTTIKEQGRQLIIPLHPDHGGTDEGFITGMNELNRRRGQCKLRRKRGDTGRNKPTRNPNTGKPMSKKKYKQQEKRRRQQEARERARTKRQQEADARAGRRQQQENTESTGTNYMENIGVGAAAVGAAGLVAREMGRGRPRVRNTRIVTRNDGTRVLVRNDDGSIVRELTPERR